MKTLGFPQLIESTASKNEGATVLKKYASQSLGERSSYVFDFDFTA
jgi:hypothetical protein